MTKNQPNFHFLFSFIPFFICSVVITLILLQKVNQVTCFVGSIETKNLCQKIMDKYLGKSMFFYEFDSVENFRTIYEDDEQQIYSLISLEKHLPGTLIFNFKEDPIYYQLELNANKYSISKSGLIKGANVGQEIPLIVSHQDISAFTSDKMKLDAQFHQYFLALVMELEKQKIDFGQIIYEDEFLIKILLNSGHEVYLKKQANIKTSLEKLRLILLSNEFSTLGQEKKVIDLRFNLAILR